MHSSSSATQHPVPFTCDTQVFTCFKPLQLNGCPLFEKATEQKQHPVLGHQSCTRPAAHLCLLRPCLLPAMPCHRAPPQLLWAYTEAVHGDICPQVKTLCAAGCGQKEKKKNHLSKTSCSAAQQFTFQGLYRLPHCPMRETAPFLKSHPLTCLPQTPHSHRKWDIVSIMNTFHMCLRVPAKEKYQKPAAT